jgi:sulfate adenylyltransferase subunit 2
MTGYSKQLEAESIHIIREVAAEFEKPVMLYSIGKDSVHGPPGRKGVLPRQAAVSADARRHDVEVPRDDRVPRQLRSAKELGWELLVHINEEGVKQGIGPFTHGSKVHTDIMKTRR